MLINILLDCWKSLNFSFKVEKLDIKLTAFKNEAEYAREPPDNLHCSLINAFVENVLFYVRQNAYLTLVAHLNPGSTQYEVNFFVCFLKKETFLIYLHFMWGQYVNEKKQQNFEKGNRTTLITTSTTTTSWLEQGTHFGIVSPLRVAEYEPLIWWLKSLQNNVSKPILIFRANAVL